MADESQKAKAEKLLDEIDEHERVSLEPDGTRILILKRPIKLKDKEIAELVFKDELTVADLEETDKADGDMSRAARLISAAAGVQYQHIRKLTSSDFNLASAIVGKISGNDEATGGTS